MFLVCAAASTATAFNVYRSIEGAEAVKLNAEPIAATTDFIDEQPPVTGYYLGVSGADSAKTVGLFGGKGDGP